VVPLEVFEEVWLECRPGSGRPAWDVAVVSRLRTQRFGLVTIGTQAEEEMKNRATGSQRQGVVDEWMNAGVLNASNNPAAYVAFFLKKQHTYVGQHSHATTAELGN